MAEEIKREDYSGHLLEQRLSTRGLPPEKQFELCRDVLGEGRAPIRMELERHEEGYAADMLVRNFGPILFSYTSGNTASRNPVRFIRQRSEIARTGDHGLYVLLSLGGSADINYDHASPKVEQGSWNFLNTEDSLAGAVNGIPSRQIWAHIPEEQCAPLLRHAGRFFGVSQHPGNMANALVTSYLKTLVSFPMPDGAQAVALGKHFVDLLALALNQTREQFEVSQGGVSAALLACIERQIETHYLDHEFTPARAAANLRITPRYLHKILEPTGTSFSERVMQRRLRHAQELLGAPTALRLSILDVALDSGFKNAEHFSQRFRAAFGMTPREFRNGRNNRPDA